MAMRRIGFLLAPRAPGANISPGAGQNGFTAGPGQVLPSEATGQTAPGMGSEPQGELHLLRPGLGLGSIGLQGLG